MNDQRPEQLKKFRSFLSHDPANIPLLTDIAWLELQVGELENATSSAQKILAQSPKNASAHVVLGLIGIRKGQFAEASESLQQAIELGDTSSTTVYHHAYALTLQGKYAEAETSAKTAANFYEEFPFAPAIYLRTLHYLGKLDEAITYATQLQHDGINVPALQGMLSTIYLDSENLAGAADAAKAALIQNPDDMDAHTTMGLLALGDMDSKAALDEFDRVISQQSSNGRAALGRGLSILLAGDLNGATEALETAVSSTNMQEHIGTWQTLAWCYILKKDAVNAERVLQTALSLDRNFAETHGGLAIVALMRGNIDSAVQAAKRAHHLDRNNFAGNFAQSLIQQISGNAEQARAIVDQLLSQPVLPGGKTVQGAISEMLAKQEGRRLPSAQKVQ